MVGLSPKLQAGLRAFADVGGMEPLARTSECGRAKPAGLPFMFCSTHFHTKGPQSVAVFLILWYLVQTRLAQVC